MNNVLLLLIKSISKPRRTNECLRYHSKETFLNLYWFLFFMRCLIFLFSFLIYLLLLTVIVKILLTLLSNWNWHWFSWCAMMRWMAWIFLLIVVLFRNNPKQLIVEVDRRNLKLIKVTRKFATVYTVKKTVKARRISTTTYFEITNIVLLL